MKLKLVLCLLVMAFNGLSLFAQDDEKPSVTVMGKVFDATTKEPLAAKIKFESLPYGSKIGVFSGDNFTFSMENETDYLIVVQADGYSAHTETIKFADHLELKIEKEIELTPNGVNRLIRLEKLIFALGKDNITPASYQELDELVNMLNASPNMTIQLEGHTDFRGNAKQNMKLSERRVEAVRDYLTKKGINKSRIKTKAFGGTQPLSREDDTESRSKNRRVEVRILTN